MCSATYAKSLQSSLVSSADLFKLKNPNRRLKGVIYSRGDNKFIKTIALRFALGAGEVETD